MTDPWLSRQQAHDAQWVELDAQLQAVVEAAVAELLAKLWRFVLGERVAMTAAAQPPSLDGAEQAARETWQQALTRWVRPILFSHYQRQYTQTAQGLGAPVNARDAWWDQTLSRALETADRVVQAVRDTVRDHPAESIPQLRDRIASTLDLDAPSKAIRDEIAQTEARLATLGRLSAAQQDDAYSRRVRLKAEQFRIEASRARSQAYQALASEIPADADQFRDLARQSARSAGDLDRVRRELATLEDQMFTGKRDADQDTADEIARLKRKRQHLYGQVDEADETWHNTALRIARTESTNVLNEATLQSGLDMEAASGEEFIKVWIAANDSRTRPTHARGTGAHGQTQPLAEPFEVGDALLMRPGDPDGPLDEVIQCRCSITVLTAAEHEEIAAVLAAAALPEEETVSDLEGLPPLMWHGVITKEGVYTGDGRKFLAGGIRTQPLPTPIRFQREDWGGHTGAVVTANMEAMRRYDGAIRAWGTFADGTLVPEVDENVGLMATRMMRGISIDADDSVFAPEIDAEGNLYEVYESIRIRAATFVAIPAYHEAEVFLGPPPDSWLLEGEPVAVEQIHHETSPVDLEDLDALVADVAMPENRPEFWAAGEGGARIAWGTQGDFPRCREMLAPYVSTGRVSAVCANLHYQALGYWPGRDETTPALVAAADTIAYTLADFAPWEDHENGPGEGGVTPITITDDGHVYGTVAPWGACHTGFSDRCVTPPKSVTQYGYFHTGGVKLADGTVLPIGKLTAAGGHAGMSLSARQAMSHYDDTTTCVALVRAFENAVGIQVSGVILPTATTEQIMELQFSPLSGDWRPVREGLEMIAAHCVNAPGFAVRRTEPVGTTAKSWALVATAGGKQSALITGMAAPERPVDPVIRERAEALAASVGLDLRSRAARVTVPAPSAAELQARVAAVAARIIPTSKEA